MKKGDKILIKATNEIAVISDFQRGNNKSFIYADIGESRKVYYMNEFYLLVEPSKALNPTHKEFLEFLDNNPATPEPKEETKQELTKREKELIWLADFEAEQRYNDINNSFHL
jgi:hypothetical protein